MTLVSYQNVGEKNSKKRSSTEELYYTGAEKTTKFARNREKNRKESRDSLETQDTPQLSIKELDETSASRRPGSLRNLASRRL
jgi:hypothetical protein